MRSSPPTAPEKPPSSVLRDHRPLPIYYARGGGLPAEAWEGALKAGGALRLPLRSCCREGGSRGPVSGLGVVWLSVAAAVQARGDNCVSPSGMSLWQSLLGPRRSSCPAASLLLSHPHLVPHTYYMHRSAVIGPGEECGVPFGGAKDNGAAPAKADTARLSADAGTPRLRPRPGLKAHHAGRRRFAGINSARSRCLFCEPGHTCL